MHRSTTVAVTVTAVPFWFTRLMRISLPHSGLRFGFPPLGTASNVAWPMASTLWFALDVYPQAPMPGS